MENPKNIVDIPFSSERDDSNYNLQGLTHTDSTSTKKFGSLLGNEATYTRVKNAYQITTYQA